MSEITRVVSPAVSEPPAGTWSNCLVAGGIAYVAGMTARGTGETGLIDQAMLSKHLKEAVSPIYYVAGPPEMVKGLHTVINETGVDDDDIRAEEFSGY